jgi:uncharacterized membrane protein
MTDQRVQRSSDAGRPRLLVAAVLLGLGLGGFFDGIVLHQILQWHHLVSAVNPPATLEDLELNTLADGLFHAGTWVVTVAGVFVLATANGQRTAPGVGRSLVGGALVGWGLFNVVEGLVDHQLLGIHHVREGAGVNETAWDLAFLAFGGLLVLGGWLLTRSDQPRVLST